MSKAADISLETAHYVRDHCLCLHTHRAARALARRFDKLLKPYGMTHGQFSMMMALSRPVAHKMSAVASLLAMDRTTLTAALKPLARRGYVSVTVDPEDRRGRRIELTAEGRKALAGAVPVWRKTHTDIEAGLAGDPDMLRAGLLELS